MPLAIFLHALGVGLVFAVVCCRRELDKFLYISAIIFNAHIAIVLYYEQRIVESAAINLVGRHFQRVAIDVDRLIVAARDAKFVKFFIKLYCVILWRTVAYGVDWRCWRALFIVVCQAGVGVFVALQHKVNFVAAN